MKRKGCHQCGSFVWREQGARDLALRRARKASTLPTGANRAAALDAQERYREARRLRIEHDATHTKLSVSSQEGPTS